MGKISPSDLGHMKLVNKVLDFINSQKGEKRIGLLYNAYLEKNGDYCFSYSTFQRIILELTERDLIAVTKIMGGELGNTTFIERIK